MAKFRIWAQCISGLYIDIEAATREEAEDFAREADVGIFHGDWMDDWEICCDSTEILPDDVIVDFVCREGEG